MPARWATQAVVATEIKDNRFSIRTDKPNVKVSWRVEGVRNDRFVRKYGSPVEKDKPVDKRGTRPRPVLCPDQLTH